MNLLQNKKERQRLFLENGGVLLEELIASFDGKCNPIRSFSIEQIIKATNDFGQSHFVSKCGSFIWYKGIIEDQPVLIKKWVIRHSRRFKEVYLDIVVSSQMSGHKNSLKLVGYCLEFPLPVLVCEYAGNGVLNPRGGISNDGTLPWKLRLKIAREIAEAVTNLHMAFPQTIIHRDINPRNIFLDKNWTAKLSDFSFSVSIPDGEQYVIEDSVKGGIGFIDPEYCKTMRITENVDIYSFGMFMLVLLTGKPAALSAPAHPLIPLYDRVTESLEKSRFTEIVDAEMLKDTGEAGRLQESQMEAFLELALRCTRYREKEAPRMIEVTKELKQIESFS